MPEDERPPSAPHLSPEEWLLLLRRGEIEIRGRMPWSSNRTYLVAVSLEGVEGHAVYKPGRGERPLWDFPGGLYRREVAAYELAVAVGLEVVPETVLRAEGPLGEGLRRVAGFDLLANNADRKGGHILVDGEGSIWGIDNGLCFHPEPKLRTVMWDFADEPLPDTVVEASRLLASGLPRSLQGLLDGESASMLVRRAAKVVRAGRFPSPGPGHRAYPWPLV